MNANDWQSIPIVVGGLTRSCRDLITLIEEMPNASAILAPGTSGAEYVAKAKKALEMAGG